MARLKRILPFIAVLTAILGFIHYFVYVVLVRSLTDDDVLKVYIAVLSGLGPILMPSGLLVTMTPWRKPLFPLTMCSYLWMGTFPIVLFFSVVEFLISLFHPHPYSLWILPASGVIAIWSIYGALRPPEIVKHKISAPEFLNGLKLVQISDLHVGMYFLKEKWLRSVVQQIQELNPDMLAITGDLTDGVYHEVAPMLEPLNDLNPSHGKFYITGNHEYIRAGEWETRMAELGFEVLHNSNKIVERNGEKLLVAGVPDRMVESHPDRALKTSHEPAYRILLAHQPLSVLQIKTESCDLALTGHTHAGQIFPFRIFVRMQQPVVSGFKRLNGVLTFAHQGTGHWGPPMRWFTRAEIVVFEF